MSVLFNTKVICLAGFKTGKDLKEIEEELRRSSKAKVPCKATLLKWSKMYAKGILTLGKNSRKLKEVPKGIARKMRAELKKNPHISQRSLASMLNISQTTVGRYLKKLRF